ncbi:MAG: hypothetical protein AMXMBFR74_23650 [Parvibaculum sp.]
MKTVNCLKSREEVCWHGHGPKDATPTLFETLNDDNSSAGIDMLWRQRENFRYARARVNECQAKSLRFWSQAMCGPNKCLAFIDREIFPSPRIVVNHNLKVTLPYATKRKKEVDLITIK